MTDEKIDLVVDDISDYLYQIKETVKYYYLKDNVEILLEMRDEIEQVNIDY
jgi:hypothetical protein